MGLMQEGLRRSGEIRNALTPVNLNPSETKTNRLPLAEHGLEVKIGVVSRIFSEQKDGKETEKLQPQETGKNGFEPFINGSENGEDNLFVNLYGGDFSQKMALNRKGVEGVLRIAHLDGKIFLTSLQPNRSRAEAHGNELAAKKFLIFGEKSKEAEEENPLARVVSVPQGWRIEINNTRITEELTEKKIGGKQLQRAFINRFNSQLKGALKECVWREKFSSEKDEHFKFKIFFSLIPILGQIAIQARFFVDPFFSTSVGVGAVIANYGIYNLLGELHKRRLRNIENAIKGLYPSSIPRRFSLARQNLDSFWEYLMPQVEIDKVARAWTFLSLKGRNLVREAKLEAK